MGNIIIRISYFKFSHDVPLFVSNVLLCNRVDTKDGWDIGFEWYQGWGS